MLPPAFLLPPQRLLTPRSGLEDLSSSPGPATGRFGAYPDGTRTRWIDTARIFPGGSGRDSPIGLFRTHHDR
jgi:hypothetical protein